MIGKIFAYLSTKELLIQTHVKNIFLKKFIIHLYKTIAWNMVIWYILSGLPELWLYSLL